LSRPGTLIEIVDFTVSMGVNGATGVDLCTVGCNRQEAEMKVACLCQMTRPEDWLCRSLRDQKSPQVPILISLTGVSKGGG